MAKSPHGKKSGGNEVAARVFIWIVLTIVGYLVVYLANIGFYEGDVESQDMLLLGSTLVAALFAFLASPADIPMLTLGLIASTRPTREVYIF